MAKARARSHANPGGGTPAVLALQRQVSAFALHAYPFGGGTGIALGAAEALGVASVRILKTLMASVANRLMIALVPAGRELRSSSAPTT